ncbi:hypothetical protein [Natrinema sp. CGMCC1.2065]|uniref:hypothetical protein n=1 Tax=Natrinema sp. CGMCC1.2065 TaxID=3445767 RepID=UPI003F4A15CD
MQIQIIGSESALQLFSLITTFIATLVGAIATLFIQWALPDDANLKTKYYANHVKKRLFNGDFTIDSKLTRAYDVNDKEVELQELSDELWEEFGVQATGMKDHFEFPKTRGNNDFDVDVRLFHEESSQGHFSLEPTSTSDHRPDGSGNSERIVNTIRVEVTAELPYHRLKDLLFREYDLLRDIEASIPQNLDGGTYSLSCDTGEPPEFNHLFSNMNFHRLKTSNENIELEYDDQKVTVRNYEEGEVDEIIDMTYKLVTLYS